MCERVVVAGHFTDRCPERPDRNDEYLRDKSMQKRKKQSRLDKCRLLEEPEGGTAVSGTYLPEEGRVRRISREM